MSNFCAVLSLLLLHRLTVIPYITFLLSVSLFLLKREESIAGYNEWLLPAVLVTASYGMRLEIVD